MPRCQASAIVTAGFRCAPETGPNARMIATSAPPVAIAFASSAIATSPPASRSAMMPEPTTAASSSAVPTASAVARRARFTLGPRILFQPCSTRIRNRTRRRPSRLHPSRNKCLLPRAPVRRSKSSPHYRVLPFPRERSTSPNGGRRDRSPKPCFGRRNSTSRPFQRRPGNRRLLNRAIVASTSAGVSTTTP